MLVNLAKRVFQLIPVLLGVSLIAFLMMSLIPGDPVRIMVGDQPITAQDEALLRHDLGLDQPPVTRYFLFVGHALTGDFGRSFFQHRPVLDVISERLPATVELTLVALIVALIVGISLGVLAAVKKNTVFDRLATVGSLFGVSLPGFWFGILLIMLFAVTLRVLPVSGRMGFDHDVVPITHFLLVDTLLRGQFDAFWDALAHVILPAITLGLPMAAILMRVTRSSMLEVLRNDYMVFAEAKGLGRWRILWRHALKNALIPTVTVAALETGSLLGGNMIVETVFGWPGLGRLVVESIFKRDYPLVQTSVLLYAVTYVLLNFVADVLYTLLNPRVRLLISADGAFVESERADRGQSPFARRLQNFAANRTAMVSALIIVGFVLMAIFAPLLAPHDPNHTNLLRRLQPPAWQKGGDWAFLLGCDALGRDILSRIIFGSRVSITVGAAVVFIATTFGLLMGLAAGYFRGWVDVVVSRVADVLLGFPYLIFALGLMAMMGPGLPNVVLALALKEWVVPFRVVRGETLAAREMDYVEAARAVGATSRHIMLREILPNILSPVIVVSTIRMAVVILLVASLSFLGLGVQPPTASWGSMVADGRAFILQAWWVSTFPGLAILMLVLAINVTSQGLRDAFDPRFAE